MSCADLFLALIAILFPPIAVWIKSGLCSCDSLINIALCCLGYLPGLIHAWYIIARHPEHDYDYEPIVDSERGGDRVTYYYVSHTTNADSRGGYGTQVQTQPAKAIPPVPSKQTKPKAKTPAPQSGPSASGSASGSGSAAPALEGPSVGAGEAQEGAPPSYSEVVKGDNKIQSQD